MARPLNIVPDIEAANAEYPAGRIKNEVAPDVGTPVIEELYGDIIQVFHKLMRLAGLTYNELPENETTGFQYIEALAKYVRTLSATLTNKGTVELATDAETQGGTDSQRAITPASLESKTATESRKGIAELATNAEVQTGTDIVRIVTPAGLNSKKASASALGLTKKASQLEVNAGTDTDPGSNPLYVAPSTLLTASGGLLTKILNIGDWNMDTTLNIFVAHGISGSKIRSAIAIIRSDTDSDPTPDRFDLLSSPSSSVQILSDNIKLERAASGMFDNSNYNSTSFNRGFITIQYLP